MNARERVELDRLLQTRPLASEYAALYARDPVGFSRDVLGDTVTADVAEAMLSVRDNPVTIARSANGVGKTHGAARLAVWFFRCFPGAQVYTAAAPPEDNLKRLLWGEIGALVQRRPEAFADCTVGAMHIAASAQSFITGVAIPTSGTPAQREAKFSGKHAPYLLFIVDEGDAVPEEVYRGIESCMSGGHARLLVMFNPRHEAGILYRKERDRQARVVELSAFNHPNVTSGEDIYPGAVTRETTVRRLSEWSRPVLDGERVDAECFEVPEFLVGATAPRMDGGEYPPLAPGWRRITTPSLAYMTLGRYPAQGETALISRAWIDAARARWDAYVARNGERPPEFTAPVLGLDVAEFGVDANCLTARYGGFTARPRRWNGMDPDTTASRGAGYAVDLNSRVVNVDATGVGAGVAPAILRRSGRQAVGVKVASSPTKRAQQNGVDLGEFALLRDQLWWSVREWLRTDAGAMLPPDESLVEELATPTYDFRSGKIRVMDKDAMRALLKRSPDAADSLCLTFAPELHTPVIVRRNR